MTRSNTEHSRPAQVFARRVQEARKRLGWSQGKLADELRKIGYPKSREVLTKLEGGKYRNVSVDDAFALAVALDVTPVDLLAPEEDEVLEVVPGLPLRAIHARAWIRGLPLPISPEVNWLDVVKEQLVQIVAAAKGQGMSPVTRALLRDEHLEEARTEVEALYADREEAPVA